ncbi:MAG TPA: CocE/NonD family hydrolase [Steroidobacteraceae bacterium]|jgi:putative CocE/NonD family hydrolase|nr:CocE/NonD family hydrolase [Steroidobacteraceae bacterium]
MKRQTATTPEPRAPAMRGRPWLRGARVGAAALALATVATVGLTAAPAAPATNVGPGYDIELSRMIPMRDGVELEAWITRPSDLKARAPAILTLTQYDIDGSRRGEPPYFARHGYVFVQACVRGRCRSGGVKSDNLGLQVGRDGYDVVEWIAQQPWSNGQVAMYGGSYVGMTQWRTAAQHPPHLTAIAPYVSIYPGWDVPNTNGIPQAWTAVILGYTSGRALNPAFIANRDYWFGKMLEQYAAQRPFGELDHAEGIAPDDWWMIEDGRRVPIMTAWLDHVGDETFNLAAEPKPPAYAAMSFPVLTATGFFDDDQPGALRYYRNHIAGAPTLAVAKHYLVIGPWDHGGTQSPAKDVEGLTIPDAAVIDMKKLHLDWYDWALGRGPLPAFFRDKVAYFMMGADEWRYAGTLAGASSGGELTLSLSAPEGTPGDLFHSGHLSAHAAGTEPPAQMVSDPHELPELEVAKYVADEGLTSQFRALQKRALVFHSEPFVRDTEIAGHLRLDLVCAADTPDFDLWAQVMLVKPDGSVVQLGQDMRRARFRDGPFREELLKPGETVRIPFEFHWVAWRIPAGARLRLVLAPLNSPSYQKNYNTGGRIGYENPADARVAHIRIFHDSGHASRLTLPLAGAPGS